MKYSFFLATMALLIGLHLPLTAQLHIPSPAQTLGASYTPHVFTKLAQHLQIRLSDDLLAKANGYELHVSAIAIDISSSAKGKPFVAIGAEGGWFQKASQKMMQSWGLQFEGLDWQPKVVALSKPLDMTSDKQKMSWSVAIPSDVYQKVGLDWPKDATPTVVSVSGKSLSKELIAAKAPKGSEVAVVALIVPAEKDSHKVPDWQQQQPVMLVFF